MLSLVRSFSFRFIRLSFSYYHQEDLDIVSNFMSSSMHIPSLSVDFLFRLVIKSIDKEGVSVVFIPICLFILSSFANAFGEIESFSSSFSREHLPAMTLCTLGRHSDPQQLLFVYSGSSWMLGKGKALNFFCFTY